MILSESVRAVVERLPAGWQIMSFGEVLAEPVRNGIYKSKEFHGRGARVVNMGELFGHDFISDQEMKRVELTDDDKSKSSLKDGDLLFARRSLVFEGSGKCSIVVNPPELTTFESSIIRARPNRGIAEPRFLFYLFASPVGRATVASIATRTAVSGIRGSDLWQVGLPLPPLPAQRRIAGVLSAYDELIENNQRRIQILETMARALYREWFVAFRFPDHENALRMLCFGDLCDLIKQPFINQTHINLPLLDLSRMPQRSLAPSETGKPNELTTSRIVFKSGDTLFGAIRCYLHKVVAVHYPGVTNTSVLVLRPKQANFRSLVALIASDTGTIRWAESHSNGTKMPVINWSVFRAMPSAWPSESLAQRFESIAGPMLDEIGVLADQIQNLRRTRDLLLPRLFSGQLALTDTAA